jgi:hypothetical protein
MTHGGLCFDFIVELIPPTWTQVQEAHRPAYIFKPVLWIRIWSDPELFGKVKSEAGSEIIEPDPPIDSHLLAPYHVHPNHSQFLISNP